MRGTYTIGKRILAMLLCIALLAVYLPSGILPVSAEPSDSYSAVVDAHTLEKWREYFGQMTNHAQDVELTTEYAGGVWTDKSVFKVSEIPSLLTDATYNGEGIQMEDKGDNFLVALSAIASNKQIKGYSTVPTDTVLVLDMSSSMRSTDNNGQSAVDELVEATNKAISDLLSLNKNNRVAVVVFAGNANRSFSNGNGNTQVILPLDSYTTDQNGTYLQVDPLQVQQGGGRPGSQQMVDNTNPSGLAVYDGVTGTGNQDFRTNSFEVATGTYMQDGIYEAMRLLLAADPVVQEGVQAGTARMPIMVVMGDGEPTLANPDYNGNDARTDLGTSSLYNYSSSTAVANGVTYSNRNLIAFMTSLTAAFAKNQIEEHYNSKALIYTLAYGDAVLERQEARSILDPANASDVQLDLWDRFIDGDEVRVGSYTTGSGRNQRTEYYTTQNSSVAGETLTAEDRLYVDKYFPAGDDDEMAQAFRDIVEEIIIQSKYYPTYVENDYNHDGYLTFADKIGSYMQVTDVQGIVVGERLFSGAALAEQFISGQMGSIEEPNAAGTALIESIKIRLGIADTAVAQALLSNAVKHGQVSYDSATGAFSHYIGWFSDSQGNYVDAWDASMTETQIRDAQTNKNATHIIRDYGFLGDTTVVPGVSNTDMMFMSVRVAQEIATGLTLVTWQIPASLVPTITYEVEVEVDSDGNVIRLLDLTVETGTADSPIRLLYEVKLREDIQDWNITEKVSQEYYDANGYTFYTNKWSADPEDTAQNTYSHFEPSVQNERYYFTQDTVVLQKTGTDTYAPYESSTKPSGEGYYRAYQVYEKLEGGQLRIHEHYEPITAISMGKVQPGTGSQWVIPKDTVHRYEDPQNSEKEINATGTMGYSDHPFMVSGENTYYTYSTQGNNGQLVVTPATGIRLQKNVTDGYSANVDYTFKISGGELGAAQLVRLDDQGNEASRTAIAADGEFTLKGGETVYIVGLASENYEITEKIPVGAEYKLVGITVAGVPAAGTVANVTPVLQSITDVVFTNGLKGYGSLLVGKEVEYPAGFAPTADHDSKVFTVDVTFTGDLGDMPTPAGSVKNGNVYTLQLKDTDAVTFTNIPENVTYTVAERDIPNGYTNTKIEYTNESKTITTNSADQVRVINTYAPAPVSANLKIQGTKTVVGGWPADVSFTVRLWQVEDLGSGEAIETNRTATVTAGAAGYTIDISDISFATIGRHYIRVAEDIPADADRIPDMAYDRTLGLFSIEVTDEDADGKLEIKDSAVVGYQGTPVTGNAADGWIVTKDFTNVVTKDIVYVNVQKLVEGAGGNDHRADIPFGLFADMTGSDLAAYYAITDSSGKATIAVPVTKDMLGTTGETYYLREIAHELEDRVVGMKYDESWIGAINIVWDDAANAAVVSYAPITGSTVGTYEAYTGAVIEHTNVYTPNVQSSPEIVLSGIKTLNGGNDLGGREFKFSIFDADASFHVTGSARETVTNVGNTVTFQGITYDTTGLHQLVIREEQDSVYGGVTNDPAEYHVAVLIEKYAAADGTTKLRVADGYPHIVKYGTTQTVAADAINFNNTYTVSGETSVVIQGTKVLKDRPMLSGEFTFKLTEVADATGTAKTDGLTLTAENGSASGEKATFRFPEITYTEVGTHYYKITETKGNASGVAYSDASYIVRVNVSDNGSGSLISDWVIVDSYDQAMVNAELEFTNVYTPADVQVKLAGFKTLIGKDLEAEQFSFELIRTESDFETLIRRVETVKNDIRGVIDFETLNYTAADDGKTFYYVISEVVPTPPAGGITYDAARYHITVKITDDHKGALHAAVEIQKRIVDEDMQVQMIPVDSVAFTNRYTVVGSTTTDISGTKKLSGMTLTEGQFTFLLLDGNGQQIAQTTNAQDGSFLFADVPLTEQGTHTFTVVEQNDGELGMTYDSRRYTVTVEVGDNGQGGMKVNSQSVTLDGAAAELVFENTFKKLTVSGDLRFKKQVESQTDKVLDPSEFEFVLTDDNNTETVLKTDKNGYGTIHLEYDQYDVGKTFRYVLKEKIPASPAAGVVYDRTEYILDVKVVVRSGALGTEVSVSKKTVGAGGEQIEATDAMIFVNRYEISGDATTDISGIKELSGMDMEGGEFTFLLLDADNRQIAQTTNTKTGSFVFEDVQLDKLGEHTFTVVERNDGELGMTYDGRTYTVKVVVEDDGQGGMRVKSQSVTLDGKAAELVFENTFKVLTADVDLTFRKQVESETDKMLNPADFVFVLTDEAGAETVLNTDADGNGIIRLDYDQYDVGETFRYVLKEKIPAAPAGGVVYDRTEYLIIVKIVEDGGALDTQVTVRKSSEDGQITDVSDITFLNRYEINGVAETDIFGIKELSGMDMEGGEFTFLLLDADNRQIAQTTNTKTGSFVFEDVQLDKLGEHTFTVVERNDGAMGMAYDVRTYTVKVQVEDNGQGGMRVKSQSVTLDGKAAELVFENTFQALTVDVGLDIKKLVETTAQTVLNPADYEFVLVDENGNEKGVIKPDANGDGSIRLNYDQYDLGKTFHYVLTEKIPAAPAGGVVYDRAEFLVDVKIVEDGGALDTQVTIRKKTVAADGTEQIADVNAIIFVNRYEVTGSTTTDIAGTKKLSGKAMQAGEFTFLLLDAQNRQIAQTANDISGSFVFEDVQLDKLGEHIFTVVEKNDGALGMIYDIRSYTVKIMVEDNGQGGMRVKSQSVTLDGKAAELVFENTFEALAVDVELDIKKTVKSATKVTVGPEDFRFVLIDEFGKEQGVATSDKDGNAKIRMSFTQDDLGKSFTYKLSEVDTKRTGVVYSKAVYALEITPELDAQGKLIALCKLDGKQVEEIQVEFVNVFEEAVGPQTGDNAQIGLFTGVMLVSAVMLAVLVITKKKEKMQKA